jgi:hypothetical protein
VALEVILLHPEYQGILDDADRYLDKDYSPEMGDTNPFLHMSMHVAIKEQLSINQPTGICRAICSVARIFRVSEHALPRTKSWSVWQK